MKESRYEKNIPLLKRIKNFLAIFFSINSLWLSAQEPNFKFLINLAGFKNVLYENSIAIDSSVICPGGFRKRTPLGKVLQKKIYIRPSFYPTKSEAGEFKPSPPDKTSQPTKPTNPLGRIKIEICNIDGMRIRMHGTSMVNSIGRFQGDKIVGARFSSNGCIRNDNLSIERMVGKILARSKIVKTDEQIKLLIEQHLRGEIEDWEIVNRTKPGKTAIVILEKPLEIEIYYRLWDIIKIENDKIEFNINLDIYKYLDGRKEKFLPYFQENQKNAYKYEHLKRDLDGLNLDEKQKIKIWQNLYREIKNNREVGKRIIIKIPK
ncbi:MAG: L,D-transpeptidase [Candidatus Anstonellaceae archaeon]